MNFKKDINGYFDEHFSGIYKCVKYGKQWSAYFKPTGWKSWGNSCERTNTEQSRNYRTLKAAQAACRRHQKSFGNNPTENNKLHAAER